MRIAVIGDVHANLEALTAVLAAIDAEKPDAVYCVGDIVGYGADPSACIALIRKRRIPAVIGNWDRTVAGTGEDIEGYNSRAKSSAYWTRGALSADEKKHLAALPGEIVENGVQIVHATPGEGNPVKYLMSVDDAREAFAAARAPAVFIGHTHVPIVYFDEDPVSYSNQDAFAVPAGVKALINVGAPGQPRDGDPRAIWCLYDTATRRGEFRRCEYDAQAAADKIVAAGLPPLLGERLLKGK
jgi:diadenosine tetraphosphatase ApaH/serine/threonine PP2A family protein phosphatase